MDKRINELRDRLWKKKAALQQKENLPVSINDTTAALKYIYIYIYNILMCHLFYFVKVMEMVLIRAPPSGLRVKAICISLNFLKPQMPWHSELNIANVRHLS